MAVLAVVLYHAHVGFLSGGFVGVDVFYVISGFLITDLLWREVGSSGRMSFAKFYARRVRRLLPAAVLVIIVTMVAAARWMPPLQITSVWKDGVASALYVPNYRFALTSTNYLSANAPPSPFQHYWSLGVEEQFYLLWPLLLLLAAGVLRGRRPSRHYALAGLSLVAAASLLGSLVLTKANEPWAFFSLPTRAWELAAGGLVALAAPFLSNLPGRVAVIIGWAGLSAILWSVVAYGASTAFPGTAALAPVLGAAAVITAGLPRSYRSDPPPLTASRDVPGAGLVLERPGMRFVGRISYSLYLWHWPVLILVPYAVGHSLNLAENLGLVVLSVILSTVTYALVERPGREWRTFATRPQLSLAAGGTLSALAVIVCLVASVSVQSTTGHGEAPVAALHLNASAPSGPNGAASASAPGRASTTTAPADPLVTELEAAQAQVAAAVGQSAATVAVPANLNPPLAHAAASESSEALSCLLGYTETSIGSCVVGDPAGTTSMALFGDSHATMWFPAVDAAANAMHARLYLYTKATCPAIQLSMFSPVLGRQFTECDQWRDAVVSRIQSLRPALVLLAASPNYNADDHVTLDSPQWLAGQGAVITELRQSGARVVTIGPIPSPGTSIPVCLSANLNNVPACNVPNQEGHAGVGLVGYRETGLVAEQQTVEHAGGTFVNVQPWFCTATTCPVIVDNLLVFRDVSHITVPYATYLAPLMTLELQLAAQGH